MTSARHPDLTRSAPAPSGHRSYRVDYSADVDGRLAAPETSEYDLLSYRRPSRYCPSDRFLATAAAEFGEVEDPTAAAVPKRVQRAQ